MSYWARSPMPREQLVLFTTTLDDRIPADHPVRVYVELLDNYDWSAWEAQYHGRMGQPPIHPKVLAAVWLYGLRRGITSSRRLEHAIRHSIDFMWLASGHTPDHTTLSQFRTKFSEQLKHLHKELVRVALEAGLAKLVDVGVDGTRVLASNGRYETWTSATIAQAIEKLSAEFARQLEESRRTDVQADLYGVELEALPPELADLDARKAKLAEIQQRLAEADAARRKAGTKGPAQIPRHDPDSKVLPNKTGGYAPNYTPMAATEGHGGFILDADVIVSESEPSVLLPIVDRITENFGPPENVLADGAYPTGPNIEGLQERGVAFFSNLPTPDAEKNPAIRPDPTQPVPESEWGRLPINPQSKTLDKACFTYDAEADTYYCPMGHPMPFEKTNSETKGGEKHTWNVYRSDDCAGCPLAGRCVSNRNTGGRTVTRDEYAATREQFAAKMKTEPAKEKYNERMRIAETPFGLIKGVLGLRQFLLRGLDKVRIEWRWTCTAVNLDKLVRGMIRLRAESAQATAGEAARV